MIVLGTILIVLATIGVGLLVDRKWDVIPRRERLIDRGPKLALPAHPPGAASGATSAGARPTLSPTIASPSITPSSS